MRRGAMIRAHRDKAVTLLGKHEFINNQEVTSSVNCGARRQRAIDVQTVSIRSRWVWADRRRCSGVVAMGAIGSDAAIETADIALMSDDVSKLPWLVRHARSTVAIIRQNIAFSLGVKVASVVLTLAGFASLWGAIAADMGASLAVVANSLRQIPPSQLVRARGQ